MKSAFRGLDTFQVAGFLLWAGVSIGLLLIGQDTLSSIILGFVLATLTQLFDVQKQIGEVEERVLNSTKLGQQLYKNDWLYSYIEEIVKDYNTVENSWFEIFTEGAKDRIVVCRNQLHSLAEGYIVGGLGDRFSPVASGSINVLRNR